MLGRVPRLSGVIRDYGFFSVFFWGGELLQWFAGTQYDSILACPLMGKVGHSGSSVLQQRGNRTTVNPKPSLNNPRQNTLTLNRRVLLIFITRIQHGDERKQSESTWRGKKPRKTPQTLNPVTKSKPLLRRVVGDLLRSLRIFQRPGTPPPMLWSPVSLSGSGSQVGTRKSSQEKGATIGARHQ